MEIDLRELRDWITLAAAVAAAVVPLAIHWLKQRADAKESLMSWELSVVSNREVGPDRIAEIKLIYRTIGRPIAIDSVSVVRPRGAQIAFVDFFSNEYGELTHRKPKGDWATTLTLNSDVSADIYLGGNAGLVSANHATRHFLIQLPYASFFRRSTRVSMRLVIEERSARRTRKALKVYSAEIALPARTSASKT